MSTNMPIFGPVVLEITCVVFAFKTRDIFFPLKTVVTEVSSMCMYKGHTSG